MKSNLIFTEMSFRNSFSAHNEMNMFEIPEDIIFSPKPKTKSKTKTRTDSSVLEV